MSVATKTTEPAGERRRLDSNEFRDIIGRFASGVTVITVEHEEQPYGTTASAVCSLSLEPPMLLVCLNKSSSTGQAIAAARRFAVNILGEGQADAAMRFAGKGDKFAGQRIVRGVAGQPLLGDALANLECRVVEEVTGGTHTVFLGEVEHATGRHGAPLAYFRGQFGRLELKQDDEAHHDIRARVLSRELPAGEPLSLDAVAEVVGVPRGSAYHALTKLSGEGLVTRTADGRFVVTALTVASVSEGLEARRAIELGVAASTVGRLSDEQLGELRSAVERHATGAAGAVRHRSPPRQVRAVPRVLRRPGRQPRAGRPPPPGQHGEHDHERHRRARDRRRRLRARGAERVSPPRPRARGLRGRRPHRGDRGDPPPHR